MSLRARFPYVASKAYEGPSPPNQDISLVEVAKGRTSFTPNFIVLKAGSEGHTSRTCKAMSHMWLFKFKPSETK